jgi:tRNA threonylcarbamoyladenosine biosynthesis protein TsaE
LKLKLTDSGATETLGSALAAAFPGAAAGAVIVYVHGEFGAGKTTCVRSLLHALGVHGPVRSPTYTLVETYVLAELTCVHVDLYRLRSAAELVDLGLSDYLAAGHLLLIEWPLNAGATGLHPDLDITLIYAGSGREATLRAGSGLGHAWLGNLVQDNRLIPYLSNLT